MNEKLKRMGEGKPNPFIDTQGYKDFVAAKEKEFRAKLAEQSK
jgi:hypothetical protein